MPPNSYFVKKIAQNLPYSMGSLLAHIPFSLRPGIGSVYTHRIKERKEVERLSVIEKKQWVFVRIKTLVEFAVEEIPFYRQFYEEHGFRPEHLKSFTDIESIPIIKKDDLLSWPLANRSAKRDGRYIANTGGSSGKTLSFYITPDAMGHEWAHMHKVWEKLDYQPHDLKLTFGGHYSGDLLAEYDSARHQFNINIYRDYNTVVDELTDLFQKHKVRFLHGYPSAIYDFALFCSLPSNSRLLDLVKQNLSGILFGSEYPAPQWRKKIKAIFQVDSVSWYGHTERAVLAYEREDKYQFHPFLSYGLAEAISMDDGFHLVGTSYYNFTSPLIRYDTEDLIKPVFSNDLLESFEIKEGRNGEFILDKSGSKIPLTGMIFGRHHGLFDVCQFIQVAQNNRGSARILFVPLPGKNIDQPEAHFKSEGINVDFSFQELSEPIRTPGGKVKLLVTPSLPTPCSK